MSGTPLEFSAGSNSSVIERIRKSRERCWENPRSFPRSRKEISLSIRGVGIEVWRCCLSPRQPTNQPCWMSCGRSQGSSSRGIRMRWLAPCHNCKILLQWTLTHFQAFQISPQIGYISWDDFADKSECACHTARMIRLRGATGRINSRVSAHLPRRGILPTSSRKVSHP